MALGLDTWLGLALLWLALIVWVCMGIPARERRSFRRGYARAEADFVKNKSFAAGYAKYSRAIHEVAAFHIVHNLRSEARKVLQGSNGKTTTTKDR